MKLHLPCRLRRAVVRALFAAATVVTTLASSTYADMITPDGRTATQVIQSGNVYDVYTNTVRGNTGFNSFSTFDVYADTTANLHLADGTGRLINVVRDSSSHIDGVLNSYKDGRIGGDVYFLNPHGIIVGKSGIINVGSISMSTPTAAFVEQLIARDGSISPTATQAVLAGDMPINEKGVISIKGKVNARGTAELRAGSVEVKEGKVSTDVRFHEMVNSGGRKVGAKGMSIQDGRLSFGKKPAQARKAVAEAKEQKTEKRADIAIFADIVQVDGNALDADSVYIDPISASISGPISGEVTVEARTITATNLSVKEGEKLKSLTLYAANELEDGTFDGNVSITISNSNITADEMNIYATATSDGAEALVSITGSTLVADPQTGSLTLYSISDSGNARVDIQRSTITAGNAVEAAALSGRGNASFSLDAASSITSDIMTLAAAASDGNADVSVKGKVAGISEVTICASTGNQTADSGESLEEDDVPEFTPVGGGNATVTVDGTVDAKGTLTMGAYAVGTYGDAKVIVNGNISSVATETKQVGDLGLERTEAETVNETDTDERMDEKNAAYMKRYVEYLKTLPTAQGAVGTISIDASSSAGNVSFSQAAGSQLTSSLFTSISADAAKDASVTLAGRATSGNIAVTATGDTSTLRTVQGSALMVGPCQYFVQDGTVVSVEKCNGAISLEAGTHDGDNPNPDAPAPAKRDGVLLEVAGIMAAQRGRNDGEGDGGDIYLGSAGKLTVAGTAAVGAISSSGKGGTICLDAQDYEILAAASRFVVTGKEQGHILMMSPEELNSGNINDVDEMSSNFLRSVFDPNYNGNGGGPKLLAANNNLDEYKAWQVGFSNTKLDGKIKLESDVNAIISVEGIADGTIIDGQGKYSLTLTNSSGRHWALGAHVNIGDDVKIMHVKDFTLNWDYDPMMERIMNAYLGRSTTLTVGKGFTVLASGDVSIKLAGEYNTALTFGAGVNIQAGGNVTISARTRNGIGISCFNGSNASFATLLRLAPRAQDMPGFRLASELTGVFRFNFDKFITDSVKFLETKYGEEQKPGGWSQLSQILLAIQAGGRRSEASITFADNGTKINDKTHKEENAGLIKGKTVTIGAESKAIVAGRKVSKSDFMGISFGYTHNTCKVDLGKHLTITASGFEEAGTGANKRKVSVSITSTTTSKVSLEYKYTSDNKKIALGFLASVGVDYNDLIIDDTVEISGAQDIDIKMVSTIDATPFMSLGKATQKKIDIPVPVENGDENKGNNIVNDENNKNVVPLNNEQRNVIKESENEEDVIKKDEAKEEVQEQIIQKEAAEAQRLIMMGANVQYHQGKARIGGKIVSENGSINVKSEENIDSSLTMNGSIRNTLVKAEQKRELHMETGGDYLWNVVVPCFNLSLGGLDTLAYNAQTGQATIGWKQLGEKYLGFDAVELLKNKPGGVLGDLIDRRDNSYHTNDTCFDIAVAVDVVHAENTLEFTGKAIAMNGSVTVDASSSIRVACGAETSIVGDPTKTALAGSISVPVVTGYTTVDIGAGSTIIAGKNITVHSSTTLPVSFDFFGWRGWQEMAKKSGVDKVTQIFKTLRGHLSFVGDYADNGDFGVLDTLTSSHASTYMRDTGYTKGSLDNKKSSATGGDFVVDIRNVNTKTTIGDSATLIAGAQADGEQYKPGPAGILTVNSVTSGTQVSVAGRVPWFFSTSGPVFTSGQHADSGFGFSTIVGKNELNTVTYIGKARLGAGELNVDATGDVFMLELSLLGTASAADTALQGGVNVIWDKRMTVSEISNGAAITLAANKDGEKTSSITATDGSTLLNISGMLDTTKSGKLAFGVGIALTFNNAFTAAMLGNNIDIPDSYKDTWKTIVGDNSIRPFAGEDPITLNFTGNRPFKVHAHDRSLILTIGVAGSIQTGNAAPSAGIAGNIGVSCGTTETTARQYRVYATSQPGGNDITTFADEKSTIVSVAADPAINATGQEENALVSGAVSVNIGKMDATAYVTDCTYALENGNGKRLGKFVVETKDDATVVAVDAAVALGSATAGVAAGVSANELTGITGSYLSGGSVYADSVNVISCTDLTSFSLTVGTAIDLSGINGEAGWDNIDLTLKKQVKNNANIGVGEEIEPPAGDELGDIIREGGVDLNDYYNGNQGEGGRGNALMLKGSGVSVDTGASIAISIMNMRSSAIVEGCSITSSGALEVTADDLSVITSISVGAAVKQAGGTAIAAGGVFAIAPVGSVTEAVIRQTSRLVGQLAIKANSLTLKATDHHKERVWSFGGGFGSSAGVGLVLSLGSFSGTTTMALVEGVDATIENKVDILSSSHLEATFISIGGSGSTGVFSLTGMVNYINFNNHVVTDIQNSTLTVTNTESGAFSAEAMSERNFTDGVGGLDIRLNGRKLGGGVGAALSFVFVGGNGADDTNTTQMLVSNSVINNAGKTDLLANSTTKGTMGVANANITVNGVNAGGLEVNGSVGLLNDDSLTQVDIVDTDFNKLKPAGGENDPYANAVITAKANSSSELTLGLGSLAAGIGHGLAFGASAGVLKDQASTLATMTRGSVGEAKDFALQASGQADLSGIVIGGGASLLSFSGGVVSGTIAHNVIARLSESTMDIKNKLTVKAENTTNVGTDKETAEAGGSKGPRFTVVNGSLGLFGGSASVDVSIIDVADLVQANAHNVSVTAGEMEVRADEHSYADSVAVNLAGGKYLAAAVNVLRPVLRGAAQASVTADKESFTIGGKNFNPGITTTKSYKNAKGENVNTTGNLTVAANNDQWMRSHLWAFAIALNLDLVDGQWYKSIAAAPCICVNSINMAGTADARIQGPLTLNVAGNLDITADANRQVSYTTVPVAVAASLISAAINVDVCSMRVSGDTTALTTPADDAQVETALRKIDTELNSVKNLINGVNIKQISQDARLTIKTDVKSAMSDALNSVKEIKEPKTSAVLDLATKDGDGKTTARGTATVGGNVTIHALDTINTSPHTINVTGSMLAIGVHVITSNVASVTEAIVNGTNLTAARNITIEAQQIHHDIFENEAVTIGLAAVPVAVYDWDDKSSETIKLDQTALTSSQGSISIATYSNVREDFLHVNVSAGGGNIAIFVPAFSQKDTNTLTIGDNVAIDAADAVNIKNYNESYLEANTVDATVAAIDIDVKKSGVTLGADQTLTTGNKVTITGGGKVDILQEAHRHFYWQTHHVAFGGIGLAFPFTTIKDTVNATLTIGENNIITAKTGALTIDSYVWAVAEADFYGVNATIGIEGSGSSNSSIETITNKVELKKNVKLRAKDSTVRARSEQYGDMKGNNIATSALLTVDVLNSHNDASVTSTLTIGDGFEATGVLDGDNKPTTGHSLTLEAYNKDEFLCRAEKVSASLLLLPYSRNAFYTNGKSEATVTLDGGEINVEDFTAKATTDVSVKVNQLLAGGSLLITTNAGKAQNDIPQTATVTLGTYDKKDQKDNKLKITADNVNIIAHNKYLFDRLDEVADSIVHGTGGALLIGTNDARVEATSKTTATVTLGKGSTIERRIDTARYLNRNKYKTHISATNNVESNASCNMASFGLLSIMTGQTLDTTTAEATLNLNGSIDTWGDTELTAYSHARHTMRCFFQNTGIPAPTSYFQIRNKITTTDTVNINNTVESIGNITIQSGCTNGEYTLVDGATVMPGDDDTNYTAFNWGEETTDISNVRNEYVNFAEQAKVRAGGELGIYNDSSAYTSKKVFEKTGKSIDYTKAAEDTGAKVTSEVKVGAGVELYAGLSSAVSMIFHDAPVSSVFAPEAALQFTSAQQLFAEQKKVGDLWQMNVTRGLDETTVGIFDVIWPAEKGEKPVLSIRELTLPGMAFRMVTAADNRGAFAGKLFSPDRHGLDIFIAADWAGDVETRGVTLQGHETGLFFNFKPVASTDFQVKSCAGPNLYLPEGVAIRSMAQGNLTLTGTYQFPYSTFLATSDHDLTITGQVYCGNSEFEAGGNFNLNTPTSDYALRSALSMYEGLVKGWEANVPQTIKDNAQNVVKRSGVDGSYNHATEGVYKGTSYTGTLSGDEIKNAVADAIKDKPAVVSAMGTVSINAKLVDLNGKIYSGYLNSEIVINNNFNVLTNDGKSIAVAKAQEIYAGGTGPQKIFKLDGFTGVSLVYDAGEDAIFLNSYETLEAGITITGNIVNSDPTEYSGLYVAGSTRSAKIVNNSGYTLNVGDVDLTKNSGTAGITLNNTYTQRSTTYTLENGSWKQKEYELTKGSGDTWVQGKLLSDNSVNTSGLNYEGLSDMQVELKRDMKIGITEGGRLTHDGDIGTVKGNFDTYKVKETSTAALIGKEGKEKHTIIDRIKINEAAGALQPTSPLTATYVARDKDKHPDGRAISEHTLTDKKITALNNPNVSARWQYQMTYDELVTNKIYVSASNKVAINLGSAGSGGLDITSGNVNFFGNVNAASCTVTATGSITATEEALVSAASINMAAQGGSIGGKLDTKGNKVALAFNADSATFTAGQDIYLTHASTGEIGKLVLKAGKAAELRSEGAIKNLDLTARDYASIAAQGQINVTAGFLGDPKSSYPARISLSSQMGGVSVEGGDFTRGIFTVEAQGDVSIKSTPTGSLTLDYVESREGNVGITVNGDIFTVRGADMSNPDPSFEAPLGDLAEDFYQQMLDYETKYYAKDGNGKYTNRTADGILALTKEEEAKTLESLAETFTTLYDSGRGDELGDVMLYLSGTDAVEKTEFKDTADALAYLAQHSDKLGTDYVRAYYDKMMEDITNEVILMHGPEDRNIDYGQFDETVYRLYWLTDCNGKYVNRDAKGNFISPVMDGSGQAMYTSEMCEAITKQFRGQPARGGNAPYRVEDSPLFQKLANTASGAQANTLQVGKMEDGLGALVGGQAIGEMQPTISAKRGTVSLKANNGQGDIGGGTFHFTIKPLKPEKEDGKFVYSNWAQTVIDSATRHIWPGIGAVKQNEATGEYEITLAYIEFPLSGFNKVNDAFMKRALPMDVESIAGMDLYRVFLRNYIGIDAKAIKAEGKNVLIAAGQDVKLGTGDITAENLFLSTTGALSGAVENTKAGFFNLYADKGIGSSDDYFRIGGDSTFTLGSLGDVYVKPTTKEVKVASITGKRVVVDTKSGSLVPVTVQNTVQPNIIGQRIDFYGDLDTGLSFRTTGTSREEGGLHWYGGSSGTLKFNALNTAYTFWFVREDGAPNPDQVDIGYSGHLYIVNMAGAKVHPVLQNNAKSGGALTLAAPPAMGGGSDAIAASFHQIKAKGTGSILEFEGDLTFSSLALDGEGDYTVLAPGEVLVGSAVSVGGNATLNFAGLGSTQGDAVGINSTGNLALASCEVMNDLVVNGTGNVSLEDVRLLGGEVSIAGDTVSLNGTSGSERLVLSGSNGVTGKDVSSSQIIANSSNAGVFLNSTSTNSLSGSSHKSFVASVQALDALSGVTVGDVSADGATSKVVIQAITDQLVLDGYISGAALEFYSTGDIDEEAGAMLLSLYPFWDVWQSGDPEVWDMAIEALESDIAEGYIWLVEEVESLAEKSCDSADELRRKVNAGGQPHSAAPLRFKDRKGNTVTRGQFANLITSK